MATSGKFVDLAARMSSGAIMAVVGLAAMYAGGVWFLITLAVIVGALVWELVGMLGGGPKRALTLAALAAGAFVAARLLPVGLAMPFLLAPAIAGIALLEKNRTLFMMFTAMILVASFGMGLLRDDFGFVWMFWLAIVVIATDVLGYFAGRMFGGPEIQRSDGRQIEPLDRHMAPLGPVQRITYGVAHIGRTEMRHQRPI